MSIREDDGLDKVFKKGLNEPGHLADYRESDWDAFESMLDEGEKKRPVIFWLRIAGGIAAVLLLAFGWLYMQSGVDSGVKQPLAVQPVKKVQGTNNNATTIAQVKPTTQNTATADPNITTNHKDNTGTSGGFEHQIARGPNKNTPSVNDTHTLAMDRHNQKGNSFLPLSVTAARRDTAGLQNNTDIINRRGEVLAAVNEQKIDAQKASDNDVTFPAMRYEPAFMAIKDPAIVSSSRRAQLALTVLASPNVNGVNSLNNSQVGGNIGLQFSVTVSKFTFSTGAAYSKAPYLTPFSGYHTNYTFKVDPVNVSADCRVLDIPLNVDYQVYSKAKNQFSIGSGLSSYLMLRENYFYNYTNYYSNWPTGYSVSNQNQHFLGVLNLQATYQRKLNSKLSLDIQPYYKIPLTDIGYSRVKLQTAGVAFGLKWNLNSLTKP